MRKNHTPNLQDFAVYKFWSDERNKYMWEVVDKRSNKCVSSWNTRIDAVEEAGRDQRIRDHFRMFPLDA